MCFICGCKHIHYSGFEMFGNPQVKGKIRWRDNPTENKMMSQMSQFHMMNFRGCMVRPIPTIRFCKMIHLNGFAEFVQLDISCSVAQKMYSGPLNVSILQMKSAYGAKFQYTQNVVVASTKASTRPKHLPMTITSLTRFLSLCRNALLGWKQRSHVPSSQASSFTTWRNNTTSLVIQEAVVI